MNLTQLRTLVTIAERGSLSAAARAMQISQPAVTKQVQRLEQELGTVLLKRGPQQEVAWSDAGEQVLAFSRATLDQLEALQQRLALLRAVREGALRVAASTIPGEYLVPGLLAAFHAQHPKVQIRSTIANTAEVTRRVLATEVDVGFVGAVEQATGLRVERLAGDEVVLAVPPAHAFAHRQAVTLEELSGQALLMREEGSGTRRSVERALAAARRALPPEEDVLTLGSTQAVLHAVEQGFGIGFVSARAAAQASAAGHVVAVRLEGVDLRRDLCVVYLPQVLTDPIVARFLALARLRFAE
jgi:DNA-binding transcriptional LysR family regulator